jgi:TIR domain
MSYVPGCGHDLFISYARENNRDGWISQFVLTLGRELSDLLGSRQFNPKESVFFDLRSIEIAQSFPNELAHGARGSAIFVPILSPGYLLSPWCNRERAEFFAKLPSGADPAAYIAPILIRPVEEGGLDTLHRKAQRISFLSADEQTPLPINSHEWRSRVCMFAGQIKGALQKLRRCCKPVFIGKAAERERAQQLRAWCCTELERRHFRTVPESLHILDDVERVSTHLQESGLAIHFLGGTDSAAVEAIEASVSACTGPTILYQSFGTELTPPERLWLADFERHLQTNSGSYQRLAGKNDQELLAVIDEQIGRIRSDAIKPAVHPKLAVVCGESDLESVRQLRDDICTRWHVEIRAPDFLSSDMKSMERVRRWEDYLNRSESLLFYYGATERERLELIWQAAQHHKGNLRGDWFLAPPDLDTKRQRHPDALWNIDQVIHFMEGLQSAQQA